MQPTLPQLRAHRAATRELRAAAWSDLRDAFLSPKIHALLSDESRRVIVSEVEGFDRELAVLAGMELDLISTGRTESLQSLQSAKSEDCTETRSEAPAPVSAVTTPPPASDAASAIRRATPIPLVEEPVSPSASASWDSPETAEMVAQHYASGDGF